MATNIICTLFGHKWFTGQKSSYCQRCMAHCYHERQEVINPCRNKCMTCGVDLLRHKLVQKNDDGLMECSLCGYSYTDWGIKSKKIKAQKKAEQERIASQKAEAQKQAVDCFMQYHKLQESLRGVKNGEFLCMACDRILSKNNMSKVYKRPICINCTKQLKDYYGHLVIDRIDGYNRTVTCIKCLESEDWKDAEQQGLLLKEIACGLSYIPGYCDDKRLEADINADEGITT